MMKNMNLSETLKELCIVPAVSGNEEKIEEYLENYLSKISKSVKRANGGIIANINDDSSLPTIVLDAHIDEVGFIVTSIEGAFLKFSNIGGIDARILPSQRVVIHGKKDIKGVICSVAPHLLKSKDKLFEISELYIDTCLNEEDTKKYISPGDFVSYDKNFEMLIGTRVSSSSLDDRAGVAAVLYALEKLDKDKLKYNLVVSFTREEEVGLRGAMTNAFEINADKAIVVDVSFAYSMGEKRYECSELGKGPMIGFSPVLDRSFSKELVKICKEEKIPYTPEVMEETTGTNADRYTVSRCGARCATVSIPLKYMHTPAEVVDITDIANTGMLIAKYLEKGEE